MDVKRRVDELVNIINEADYNYHTLDKPIITDQEYDKYIRELFDLESEYPEYVREDSPTHRVGGKVLDEFEKITHKIPMMSLSNVFNESEIRAFDERIRKEGFSPEYVCELKIDGLSVSLIYEKGKLVTNSETGQSLQKTIYCKPSEREINCCFGCLLMIWYICQLKKNGNLVE